MRARLATTSFVLSAVALLATPACSLLVDTAEPIQCSTNGDCDGNSALRGRVCESGFCVLPKAPITPVSNEGGEGCVSTAVCTQQNSNRASVCPHAGAACVPWQIPGCDTVSGAWDDPNAIVIGDLQPLTFLQADGRAPKVAYSQRVVKAIDLALDELAAATPQGILVGNTRRPLAVIHCDTKGDPQTAARMFDHVTDVVGATSVIVGWDEDLAAIATKATAKQTAIACSDCLAPLPQGPLAWRILPSLTSDVPLAAWRVADLEARRPSGAPPLKVAFLSEPGRVTDGFRDRLIDTLHFNGKDVAANAAAGLFTAIRTPDARKETVDHLGVATDLVAFAPDVIVVAMASDFPTYFLPLVEAQWPSGGKAKPSYVLTELSDEVAPFGAAITTDELAARVSGVHEATTPEIAANLASYTIRYKQSNNGNAPDGNVSGYDAMYSLGYAIVAASTQSLLDGPHVSAGFERLGTGFAIDFNPGATGTGLTLLLGKGTIDVRGVSSMLDWNMATRELVADRAMFCFSRTGGVLSLREAGTVRFDAKTNAVTGAFACD